uniref:Uncharacterized protein n=1 Tax=Anguilla anguilla TaxID=7936 RepID=A0A0E9R2B2_ANGAN
MKVCVHTSASWPKCSSRHC